MFRNVRDWRPSWEFFLLLGALILGWDLIVRFSDIHPIVLPSPLAVAEAFFAEIPDLLSHGGISLFEMVLGFFTGFLMGFVSAIAIFYIQFFRRTIYPFLLSFRIVPKVAFLPLFLVWFGVGIGTKVALAAFSIFFLVLVQTLLGLSTIEPEAIEFGRSLKMSEWALFRKIRLPSALPAIMVGVKLGVTYALTNVIVAEMLVAREGLGFLVVESRSRLATDNLIATIIAVAIIGLVLYAAGLALERQTTHWFIEDV